MEIKEKVNKQKTIVCISAAGVINHVLQLGAWTLFVLLPNLGKSRTLAPVFNYNQSFDMFSDKLNFL